MVFFPSLIHSSNVSGLWKLKISLLLGFGSQWLVNLVSEPVEEPSEEPAEEEAPTEEAEEPAEEESSEEEDDDDDDF